MDENRNQPGFEEKLLLVQEMITKIENGTLSLEDSVLQYEKGMKMLGELDSELEFMNRRITALHEGKETEIENTEL